MVIVCFHLLVYLVDDFMTPPWQKKCEIYYARGYYRFFNVDEQHQTDNNKKTSLVNKE